MGRNGAQFHVVFPLWGPVGGVIKILDYLHHTLAAGFDRAVAWGPPLPDDDSMIRDHAAYVDALDDDRIDFRLIRDIELELDAWVLFSEPSQHPEIEAALPTASDPSRIIHLVQNTRHANPYWHDGFPYLLLHRPLTRLYVTEEVAEAVAPVVNDRLGSRTIVEGHNWEYFTGPSTRTDPGPLRIGYTTWKSTIGDRVADTFAGDPRFVFNAIREPARWSDIRDLYHASDVFLATPGPEEGFYLPGLEAMAANNVVVSPFVGGNKAYLRADDNCLAVDYESLEDYSAAIERLHADRALCDRLLAGGHRATARHTLAREQAEFAAFIDELAASRVVA